MNVLLARDDDVPAILEIADTTPWPKHDYLRGQVRAKNVLVARDENGIAGFAVWNREFFSLPFVWLVVVAPRSRRSGIATMLFDEIERRCAGVRIYSSTNRSNDVMHRFFGRRGYRRCGEFELDPGDPEVVYLRDPA